MVGADARPRYDSTRMQPRITIPVVMLTELCRRWRLRRLAFFGSVLRDDFRADSDVDVLVEFEPGATPGFIRMEGLRDELSALLQGRHVDLVTLPALHPLLRDEILAQALPQYAA